MQVGKNVFIVHFAWYLNFVFTLRRSTWKSGQKKVFTPTFLEPGRKYGTCQDGDGWLQTSRWCRSFIFNRGSLLCSNIVKLSLKNVIALSGGSALEKAFPCYGCVAWWFCNVLWYVVWQFPKTEVVCHQFREIHVSGKDIERGKENGGVLLWSTDSQQKGSDRVKQHLSGINVKCGDV